MIGSFIGISLFIGRKKLAFIPDNNDKPIAAVKNGKVVSVIGLCVCPESVGKPKKVDCLLK